MGCYYRGKPSIPHLFSHGWHSISDIIFRTHLIYASLQQRGTRFKGSSLYNGQDPTEKGGTSYHLGMLSAKLIAEHLLDVPWLMHLSMFTTSGGVIKKVGKSEPDLIGKRRNGDWIVVEAKGRTGRYSHAAMVEAKAQTRQLRKIGGQYPALRIGVEAYFSKTLAIRIEDPEEYEDDVRDLSVDFGRAVKRYYSSILDATRESKQSKYFSGLEFVIKTIDENGTTVGIPVKIENIINRGRDVESELLQFINFSTDLKNESESMLSIHGDGILVSLDERWSEEKMSLSPIRRSG